MRLFPKVVGALAAAVISISSLPVGHAHEKLKPSHGGQIVEDANHHAVEMVVQGSALVFHLTDDGKPLDLKGSKFNAIVQSSAGTKTLALTVDGSSLKADSGQALPKGAKVVLTGKDGHGDTIQARFVVP